MALTSTIIKEPELIQNAQLPSQQLDDQSYLLFYSDAECQTFEGLKGIATGSTELPTTKDTITCQAAMACLLAPDGETCRASGGLTGATQTIVTATTEEGRDVLTCDSSSTEVTPKNCQNTTDSVCLPSPIHPSCYYRQTSAARFVQNPAAYLQSNGNNNNNDQSQPEQPTKPYNGGNTSSGGLRPLSAPLSGIFLMLLLGWQVVFTV